MARALTVTLSLILFSVVALGQQAMVPHRRNNFVTVAASGDSLNTGIVGYWKLDEASGTRADGVGTISMFDTNGVLSLVAIISSGADFEVNNTEFLASGADPTAVDFNGNQDFTLAAWIQTETQSGTRMTYIAKYDGAGNAQYYLQYVLSSDRYVFGVSNDGNAEIEVAANNYGAVPATTWAFVVLWHDAAADTINIQVNDGTANSTAHSTGIFNGTSKLFFGTLGSNARLDGYMDEVGAWNRVLTAAERTRLYNAGSGKTYPF